MGNLVLRDVPVPPRTNLPAMPNQHGNKIIDKINERIQRNEKFFSFEYFPPKTPQGVEKLDARMSSMAERGPVWMDMTWGAGGRTSDLTLTLCDKIQNEKKVDAL